MSLTHDTEHAQEMKDLLLQQFKGQPNFEALLDAWGVSVQDVEDMFWALFTERGLDSAIGKQLDILGTIVGELRGSLGDEDYRVRLRVRIRLNVSNGTDKDITDVFALLLVDSTPDIEMTEYYPAGLILRMLTYVTTTPAVLASVLQEARSAGIDAQLLYHAAPEDEAFLTSSDATPVVNSPRGFAGVNYSWQSHSAAEANVWQDVCWSPQLSLFVAIAASGTHRVMTSPDGINWTARTAVEANSWLSVCWADTLGLFVAVSNDGTHRVMTSPDGINWTARTAAEANQWTSVCWAKELGLLVAVSATGTHRVMTSANGTSWSTRTASDQNHWYSVCWAPEISRLVAVGTYDSGATLDGLIMTSADGTTWATYPTAPGTSAGWVSVCWAAGLGLLVAVTATDTYRVMTSSNAGVTWVAHTAAAANSWNKIAWSQERGSLVAVSYDGASQIMSSADGATWALDTADAPGWVSVCWAALLGIFATVAYTGASRVATSTHNKAGGKLIGVAQA